MRPEAVKFIFENVFLPPNLPQTHHNESGADDLLKETAQAACEFARSLPPSTREWRIWTQLYQSITKWIDLYDKGVPCSTKFTDSLKNIRKDGR